MRADRLLATLLLLQARGRLTAPDLAARLEVSVRTVYRDLDALSAAGVPVYATSGRNGGITLPEGYRLDLTALRPAEARALLLGAGAGPLADLAAGEALAGALRKVAVALPSETRDEAQRARQRLLVDDSGWWHPPAAPPEHLRTVEGAVWQDRRLRLEYGRFGRAPAERVVDPYALVAKQGVWYLVAAVVRDDAPAEPVTFRVSRIRSAEVLEAPAARPATFDLRAFWEGWCAAFLEHVPRYPVTVRATPAVAARLARDFARGGAPATPLGEPDATGWVTLAVDLETLDVACGALLGFGPAVEALAPAELRERLAGLSAQMATLYAGPGPGEGR